MLWAIAMPPNAAPDEDQHMVWAAATARLQLEPDGPRGEQTLKAPTVLYLERCWQWRPHLDVSCQDEIPVDPAGDIRNKPVRNAVPYYALVGAASLMTTTEATVYLMRFVHIVLVAAMLTLGVWSMSARKPTPGSIAMAAVAFTPMTAFLLGTVNPSGMAIASGFALWAGGLFAMDSRRPRTQRVLAVIVPVAAFLIVRRDAVVWLTPILLILALHADPRRIYQAVRGRTLRIALYAAPAVLAALYLLGGDTIVRWFSNQAGNDQAGTASSAFGILPYYIKEMVGELGWIDVAMPQPVLMGWYAMIALAIVVSVGASRRDGWATLAVIVFVLVIPFLFGVFYRYRYFQSRYGMPLALGIPLIASAALTAHRTRHLLNARMARLVVWTVATLSTVAFAVALRRFTVGYRSPWNDMLFDPAWTPPVPTFVALGAYAVLMAGLAVVLSRIIGDHDHPGGARDRG